MHTHDNDIYLLCKYVTSQLALYLGVHQLILLPSMMVSPRHHNNNIGKSAYQKRTVYCKPGKCVSLCGAILLEAINSNTLAIVSLLLYPYHMVSVYALKRLLHLSPIFLGTGTWY